MLASPFKKPCGSNRAVRMCLWPSWVSPPLLCEQWSTDAPLHSRLKSDGITVLSSSYERPQQGRARTTPILHDVRQPLTSVTDDSFFVFRHTRLLTTSRLCTFSMFPIIKWVLVVVDVFFLFFIYPEKIVICAGFQHFSSSQSYLSTHRLLWIAQRNYIFGLWRLCPMTDLYHTFVSWKHGTV